MVRERNREIEAIINKLGDETHDTQKQLLTQYERKVKDVESKWKADVEDYKVTIKQWKDKLVQEEQNRHMLDDNLRVLSRRINDLELDIQDKKQKILDLASEKQILESQLNSIQKNQDRLVQEVEEEFQDKLDQKLKDLRIIKEHQLEEQHAHELEVESLKAQNKADLEMIQEKVQIAMQKKKEIIDALHDEVKIKDLQVTKLKEMLEKQRRELL